MSDKHGPDCGVCDVWHPLEEPPRPVCAMADTHIMNALKMVQTFDEDATDPYGLRPDAWIEIFNDEIDRRKDLNIWMIPNLSERR